MSGTGREREGRTGPVEGRNERPWYQRKARELREAYAEWEPRLRSENDTNIEYLDPRTLEMSRLFRRGGTRTTKETTRLQNDAERYDLLDERLTYYLRAERAARAVLEQGGRPSWELMAICMHATGKGYRRISKATGKGRDLIGEAVRGMLNDSA